MFNPSPSADAARGRRTMPNQDSMREQHLSADNDSLVAENARLQARVEEAERRSHKGGWVCDCDCHEEIDGLEGADYKALAERRKEALEADVELLRTLASLHHDNLDATQELRVLKVLNQARAAIEEGKR